MPISPGKRKAEPVEASVFMNGKSQAVRIPAEYRFRGNRVFVRRDAATGDLVLSEKPPLSWEGFFAAHEGERAPDDFLSDRDQGSDRDRFLL